MPVPLAIPALGGMLGGIAASLTGRVLMALGVSLVTYTGVDVAIDGVKDQVASVWGQLPQLAIQVFSVLQLDTCLNISISAVVARALVSTVSSGQITKLFFK